MDTKPLATGLQKTWLLLCLVAGLLARRCEDVAPGAAHFDLEAAVGQTVFGFNCQAIHPVGLLRQRRLRWLQHLVRHPNHHKLYFASMFGRFGWKICRRELDDHGKSVQHAIPALRQMYDDLAAAVPEFQGFQPGWMQLLLACDPSFSWVLPNR